MGARSTDATLTETGGGPVPDRSRLYVGIDVGRRHHLAVAIPAERMENGTWERAAAHKVPTNGQGFRELALWLESFGLEVDQVSLACEPTRGGYAPTRGSWREGYGYRVDWLQNWALHDKRKLMIGKQTKTDALDARLIARLLYERDCLGSVRGFLHRPPRNSEALRLLVRNRLKLVEQRTRYRLQLTAIEDVLFPELKDFFKNSITGATARLLLEAYATPAHVAAADPDDVYEVVVRQGHARALAPRLPDLQRLAAASAGLVDDLDPILQTQDWLLYQLRQVDDQVANVEDTIGNALEAWPLPERQIMESLPAMTQLRQAVLLAVLGDLTSFRDDRQVRKLLGWYPESKESGSSLSQHRLGHSGNRLGRREVWLWSFNLLSPTHPPTPFRAYYHRLRDRGMAGHVAVGHLASKLISILFFCMRSGQPYDPDRHAHDLGLAGDWRDSGH
ncbi:MAG: IS110 family transposase [Candidatus Dormibacteria bacterium]